MSVREQIFIRTDRKPAEIAGVIATLVNGRTEVSNDDTWLLVSIGTLLPDSDLRSAEFGGPVLPYVADPPFQPGEFEATDAYNVEVRLWLAGARNEALEAAAADQIFAVVARMEVAAVQVRRDDKLIRAVLPGRAPYDFPAGTLIYETDRDRWNGYVLEA
ncbi:hypothetical protein [Symbioplanes lichenis]|uniref:hypothetical protein n=1 Tax=Symbioplanes lichenis TaxID=1629072 RepID=UPI002739E93B|nr:hypothetical protein [Actinoplanes lichenis]